MPTSTHSSVNMFYHRVDEGIGPYGFYYGFRNDRGIVTGGKPQRGPHQSADWLAMAYVYDSTQKKMGLPRTLRQSHFYHFSRFSKVAGLRAVRCTR